MKKIYVRLIIAALILATFNGPPAFPQRTQLTHLTSRNLDMISVDKGYSYLVPHTARCFENAMAFHNKFWNYYPKERTTVLLNDFTDQGNGGTSVIPWNFLNIAIAPFDYTFNVVPANERMQWLMEHELTHQVMCDKPSPTDNFYRKIFFGKIMPVPENPVTMLYSYLAVPRWYSPRWYHEGIAVFMETWMSGGLGRVLGGYDEMIFRTMVRDSNYFYKVIGLESEGTTVDFQVGVNSYLYGTRFDSYLAHKYGTDNLRKFYNRTPDSRRFYASQFKHVFGIGVEREWENWVRWEKKFQHENLEKIRSFPVTKPKPVINIELGSVSQPCYDKNERKIYAAVNYPGKLAHISAIDLNTGKMKTIAQVPNPGLFYVTSIAFEDSSKTLFISNHNSNWRSLCSVDIRTGRTKELIKLSRAGDFAMNRKDKALWALQTLCGRVTLVRIPPPYNKYYDVYTLEFGKSLFDINISPDGKLMAATMSEVSGKQRLVMFRLDSLMAGIHGYEQVYEFEDNNAANFVFSDDGRYLYGTSYYTGVSNVYRIELATKKVDLLSNTETGLFRPVPISPDTLLVMEFVSKGMVPGLMKVAPIEDANAINYLGQMVVEKFPEVEKWILPPPSKMNMDTLDVKEGKYSTFSQIRLASAYPILAGYKDVVAWGYQVNFLDPTYLHRVSLSAAYSNYSFIPEKQRLHLALDYNFWNWNVKATWNYADFYDLFGPTKLSRAGYSVSAKYHRFIYFFNPTKIDFTIKAAMYGDLENMPDYQNVAATYDKFFSGIANFHYSYLRKSLGAVEPEQGFEWNLYSQNNLVKDNITPRIFTSFDAGFLMPVRNTALWFRGSAGHSFGERDNPFGNFYFGGFGNNYIDHLSIQRYREIESFPGRKINEIGGKNFGKLTTELNIRPLRFRKAGILPFYSTYARLSLFGSGLMTDFDESSLSHGYCSAGAQLDFELVLFSLLKSTLSFGYARTLEYKPGEEFMISLKLL